MNRETALAALVSEVMQWHADPESSGYNECDELVSRNPYIAKPKEPAHE